MSNGKSDTLTAFLLGALTGGIAALMFAPTSGPELRRRISETGEKVKKDTWDMATRALETAEKRARDAAEEARRAVEDVKVVADRQRTALREAYEEGKLAYKRELERSAAERVDEVVEAESS